jgi:hypothetical protein
MAGLPQEVLVIAGFDPAIQLLSKKMDARIEAGHDHRKAIAPEC